MTQDAEPTGQACVTEDAGPRNGACISQDPEHTHIQDAEPASGAAVGHVGSADASVRIRSGIPMKDPN